MANRVTKTPRIALLPIRPGTVATPRSKIEPRQNALLRTKHEINARHWSPQVPPTNEILLQHSFNVHNPFESIQKPQPFDPVGCFSFPTHVVLALLIRFHLFVFLHSLVSVPSASLLFADRN